jgi:MFS family permease
MRRNADRSGNAQGGGRPPAAGESRRVLATLSLTVTVSYGVLIYAFPVVLRPMERGLGLQRGETSAALSIGLLVSALAAFPTGRWLDRRSPRHLMTFGSLLAVGGLIAWSAVSSLWQLYAVFALLGVAMALVLYPAAFAVVTKLYWPSPRRALTALTIVGGLAGIVFTPLTEWLVEGIHWRAALIVLAAVALLATVVPHAAFLPRRSVQGADKTDADGDGDPFSRTEAVSVPAEAAVRGAAFWALTLALFLTYFISVALIVHLIQYLTQRGFSVGFAALAAGLVGAMQIPGRALMLPLERRVPRIALTTGVFGLEALALFILPVTRGIAAVLVFVVLFGMARGVVPLVGAMLVADFYGPANYGAIGGAIGFFTAIAQALAPGGVGLLYDHFHGYLEVSWLLVAAAVTATICGFVAERCAPQRAEPGPRVKTSGKDLAELLESGRI